MLKINKVPIFFFLLTVLVLDSNAKDIKNEKRTTKIYIKSQFSTSQQGDKSTAFLKSFFRWYKTKFDYLDHHIFTVKMDTVYTPYRVDFKQVERYLSILKSSGFFSENYINNYRNYFKKIDLSLQKSKQNDGAVDGLDFDPILHSQEPESILAKLNNIGLKVVKSTANDVTVKVTPYHDDVDTYLLYYLKKNNGKYVIDKINF